MIAEELLTFLSVTYPAIDVSRSAITGHSSGGWGTLAIGMRYSKTFRVIAAFSPVWSLADSLCSQMAYAFYVYSDLRLQRRRGAGMVK